MKVILVSQCSKNAIKETRRIIDQFAERKGDCIWETNITEQGLETVKKLLKSTARRNTAVACHLLRGRLQSELLWIVGNHRIFSREGNVPTNVTAKDILRADDENNWNTGEAIAILAAIAGLFHDFGKADALFQLKLKGKRKKNYEPFRHEWISLLLFKQFVGGLTDKEWIEKLSRISLKDENELLSSFPKVDLKLSNSLIGNLLNGLPQLAKFIGWLILSHHRLPQYKENDLGREPQFDKINDWIDGDRLSVLWGYANYEDASKFVDCKDIWSDKELKKIGTFPQGTPIKSQSWRSSAQRAAFRALRYYDIINRDWFKDRFSMHLMRMVLMLSDHLYSAGSVKEVYQDDDYEAYANTDRISKLLKQKLDEHNIGVAKNAFMIAKRIPRLREALPSISMHKGFKKRNKDARFLWQDEAYDLAYSLRNVSDERGFFGINLASTGCGKTLANARIMYGLSDEKRGCRFSVALGLRVLTLQTGDAFQEKLHLKSDDLAVLIGSHAFQHLHELKSKSVLEDSDPSGSESSESLMDEEDYVRYDGSLADVYIKQWFGSSPNLHKMISAPIFVSTVDHLINATEGCRGGKQIAPILRLLTSDLVLDEPDDFDVADLPALCRLVNFAGVFGSRVLLSSATLPPSIVQALFDAYASGRNAFNQACRKTSRESGIYCAWFDEYGVASSEHANPETYMISHREFIDARVSELEKQTILRKASLSSYESKPSNSEEAKLLMVETIRKSIYFLHDRHHQTHSTNGKNISVGLVRMANIDPMVSVVQKLLSEPVYAGYCVHFCVYHSRFPLLIRSKIEEVLDNVLSRHDPKKIWELDAIKSSLSGKNETNHLFVVFATAVAEVGRDHDYDWAVVEPSSMRSIIQLAGRVQRHRKISPAESNLIILQNNLKGLKGVKEAYAKPGFESREYCLADKDLKSSLHPQQYEKITAIPRLRPPDHLDFCGNLSDLEHMRLKAILFGMKKSEFHASMWWKHNADWCGELQRHSSFRKSDGKYNDYIYYLEDESETPWLYKLNKGAIGPRSERDFEKRSFNTVQGIYPWIDCDVKKEITNISERTNLSLRKTSLKFATIRLRDLKDQSTWINDPIFGFYQEY